MDILKGLNKKQYEAASHCAGPILILAGAGSGKTRALTHRIAYLVMEKGISPYNILGITFTNKAAKEMKERVEKILKITTEGLWISTFHASCVRILRRNIENIGFNKNFVIFDTSDQKTVLKECVKELQINEKNFPIRFLQNTISSEKDNLTDSAQFLKENEGDFRKSKIANVYCLYQKKLKANNAMDFDDLIFYTIKLLEQEKEVLKYYQEKFKYILVDEYQDTNKAQYKLIKLLSQAHENICVVGDDDQSIYKFRGADIKNILDFEKEFKKCKVVRLEQNYRSTKNIINGANNVILNNGGRKEKSMWTDNKEGELIKFKDCQNEHDEGQYIASEIKNRSIDDGRNYNDFALLYRMNAQSRVLESMLIKEGIPYKIYGGLRFYDRKEVKDIIGYLRLIQNGYDDVSLKRVINVPKRGIGNTTISKMDDIALSQDIRLYDILENAENYPTLGRASEKLKKFVSMINELRSNFNEIPLSKFVEKLILRIGIIKELEEENTIESQTRIENIKEFTSSAIEFEQTSEDKSLFGFLERIALVSDIDTLDEEVEKVTLMTIHSSKGLEFPVVFLTGLEEGVFPGYQALMDECELEEERRLCYVGMTRAKDILYMTKAKSRMLFGNTTYNRVSQFIGEIAPENMENLTDVFTGVSNTISHGNNSFGSRAMPVIGGGSVIQNNNYKLGQDVNHKKFGLGTITNIEIDGDDKRLEINFKDNGIIRLMASYARLEVL